MLLEPEPLESEPLEPVLLDPVPLEPVLPQPVPLEPVSSVVPLDVLANPELPLLVVESLPPFPVEDEGGALVDDAPEVLVDPVASGLDGSSQPTAANTAEQTTNSNTTVGRRTPSA